LQEKNIYNPKSKMANRALRQAMGYALDNNEIGQKAFQGLRVEANTAILPIYGSLHATSQEVPGFPIDMAKARKLLDDAGYKDINNDGIREDPKGNQLVIYFAAIDEGETSKLLTDYYQHQWQKIGLNVKLAEGKLMDFYDFYDRVQKDDPGIDVYMAAWRSDFNPSPKTMYGENAVQNFTRFVSKENSDLLNKIDSEASLDEITRRAAYLDWQEYVAKEAYIIPTLYRYAITPVNRRVSGYSVTTHQTAKMWANVGVTSKER
jgi:peptide/nickel transport system substrate-binding protein